MRSLARRLAHRQHPARRLSENPSSSAGFAGAIRPLGEAQRGPPRPPSMGNEVWRSQLERHWQDAEEPGGPLEEVQMRGRDDSFTRSETYAAVRRREERPRQRCSRVLGAVW